MADIIDQVQEWNELHTRVSLLNQGIKSLPERPDGFDGKHCIDCEDPIEAPRLKLGRCRCIGCQDLKERDDAARARNGRPE